MKKIIYFFVSFLFTSTLFAQTSNRPFNFQGYAIDPDGKALASVSITVSFKIYPKTGTAATYTEEQTLISDAYGVFTAQIGSVTSSDFQKLNFTGVDVDYWLEVKVRKTSGGVFTIINDARMSAVPYARFAENGVPVGTVVPFAGPKTKIPAGWLLCDGSQYDGTLSQYAQLYSIIGTTWGGSGSNFKVPDMRGAFLRGLDDNRQIDPDYATRTLGTFQAEDFKAHLHSGTTDNGGEHSHTYTDARINEASDSGDYSDGDGTGEQYPMQTTSTAPNHTHPFTTGNTGGAETRPDNVAVYYIIKY